MSLNFNTTITNLPSRLWQISENYLHINQKQFKVERIDNNKISLLETKTEPNYILLALKILSYATIVLPLAALAIKAAYRHAHELTPSTKKYIWMKHPTYDPGMFYAFNIAMGILHHYENNKQDYKGVVIDFKDRGLYYDTAKGSNWWEYYCEPIKLGDPEELKQLDESECIQYTNDEYAKHAWVLEKQLTRQEVNAILSKYVKIRPAIAQQVEDFVNREFKNHHVIGIHYRGTDKVVGNIAEAPLVKYETALETIRKQVQNLPSNYKIFVATDEQAFLDCIKKEFPGKIIEKDCERSTDGQPLHINNKNPAKQGEQALVDALLLSKTQLLIRTSSNLSLWSTYFNATMPVVELSKRLGE